MCGHCIVEGYLMARIADPENATPTRCERIHLDMALMHATDIRGALRSLRDSGRESQATLVVVLSLVLEVFVNEGFDPELAAWADDRYVGKWQALANGMSLPGGRARLSDVLLTRSFWTSGNGLNDLKDRQVETVREAERVLTEYRDWWYQGQGKMPVPLPEERLRTRGIMDPIAMTSGEDFERLYVDLPIVYLGALWLSRQPGGHPLLEEIALATPPAVPGFTGVDLWLQRRCLDWVCRIQGDSYFKRELARIPWHGLLEVAMRQEWEGERKVFVRESIAKGACDVGVGLPEWFLDECDAWTNIALAIKPN